MTEQSTIHYERTSPQVAGGGCTERLPRTVGGDRALEVILTSADYDASTAERWGWVTRALPDAELDAFVDVIIGPPCAAHAAVASVLGSDVSCSSKVSVSSASG